MIRFIKARLRLLMPFTRSPANIQIAMALSVAATQNEGDGLQHHFECEHKYQADYHTRGSIEMPHLAGSSNVPIEIASI